jgi:hypothetical protein
VSGLQFTQLPKTRVTAVKKLSAFGHFINLVRTICNSGTFPSICGNAEPPAVDTYKKKEVVMYRVAHYFFALSLFRRISLL